MTKKLAQEYSLKIIKGIVMLHQKISTLCKYRNTKNKSKIKAINQTMSIRTLNVNELNNPVKRQRLAEWGEKTRSNYMLFTGDIFPIQTYK